MIHFSCDRCKCSIDPRDQLRYVVRIEIRASLDFEDAIDDDVNQDNLMDLEDSLACLDAMESDSVGEDVFQQRRFDLCPDCYRKFARNPVGRDAVELNFSNN